MSSRCGREDSTINKTINGKEIDFCHIGICAHSNQIIHCIFQCSNTSISRKVDNHNLGREGLVIIGDGRRSKQGPITRAMTRHIRDQEELETQVHIKMLTTLSLYDNL